MLILWFDFFICRGRVNIGIVVCHFLCAWGKMNIHCLTFSYVGEGEC